MRKRVELAMEVAFPPDPLEMRAVAVELEEKLDRESWAAVEALAVAILLRGNPWAVAAIDQAWRQRPE
jgi:hypothetical protein